MTWSGRSAPSELSRHSPRGEAFALGRADLREELPCQVVEHRRGKTDAVDPIQHAGVPLDKRPRIADAAIPLDGRQRHASGKAHDRRDHL